MIKTIETLKAMAFCSRPDVKAIYRVMKDRGFIIPQSNAYRQIFTIFRKPCNDYLFSGAEDEDEEDDDDDRRVHASSVSRAKIVNEILAQSEYKEFLDKELQRRNIMKILAKKLDSQAVMPEKGHDKDYCLDIRAVEVIPIKGRKDWYKVRTGWAFSLVKDKNKKEEKDLCLTLRPRSSITDHGCMIPNSPCTIDDGYTGEVVLKMYHFDKSLPMYKAGEKVCQMHIDEARKGYMEIVDELPESERGEGGFGSTGK